MYFYTKSDKKDSSSYTQVATFYIDKFPAAFDATTVYYNAKGVSSDDTLVRVDLASKIEYEFEEEEHAKNWETYQAQVLTTFKKKTESEQAVALCELLLGQKEQILQLPTSVKQAECTIQRFYLFLWPLLNLAESGNYDKAKELTIKFIDLLLNESEYSLKIKGDSLVQLYSSVHTNSGIKSFAFERLIQLCLEANTTDIIVSRARSIVTESASWNLTQAERRSLYRTVGYALD